MWTGRTDYTCARHNSLDTIIKHSSQNILVTDASQCTTQFAVAATNHSRRIQYRWNLVSWDESRWGQVRWDNLWKIPLQFRGFDEHNASVNGTDRQTDGRTDGSQHRFMTLHRSWLVAWHSGRTSDSGGKLSLFHARLAANGWVTTIVGTPPATSQPTRPTQPLILSGLINK